MSDPVASGAGDDRERDVASDEAVDLLALTEAADRLDGLAEMAEVMDDAAGADRFRDAAARARLRAMALLDD